MAIVSQDPQLLSGTILENVSVGLTGTPNELKSDGSNLADVESLCRRALQQAQAWNFVQKLPTGIHTFVSGGKTGVLSGGQKQRSELHFLHFSRLVQGFETDLSSFSSLVISRRC